MNCALFTGAHRTRTLALYHVQPTARAANGHYHRPRDEGQGADHHRRWRQAVDAGAHRHVAVREESQRRCVACLLRVLRRPDDACVRAAKWPEILTPLRNVLWAETSSTGDLELSLLAKKKKKANLALVHITGKVEGAQQQEAAAFTEAVLEVAFRGPYRLYLQDTVLGADSTPQE